MRITVRRLAVEPRIERRIAKRQFLRVALPKRQPLDPMPLPAKRDAGGIQTSPVVRAGRSVRVSHDAPPPWPQLTSSTVFPRKSVCVATW